MPTPTSVRSVPGHSMAVRRPDSPLRILHVFTPAPAGGLESVVQMLATGQAGRGAEVGVVAVLEEGIAEPPCVAALRASGLALFVYRLPSRGYRAEWAAYREAVVRWLPDIVHTHGYRADILGGYAVGHRARRMTTVHGFTGGDWKLRLYEWLQLRAYRGFDAVVAVSRSVCERLLRSGVPAGSIEVIPNAWMPPAPPLDRSSARAHLGLPPEARVIGWVGRLSPEKGADLLLAAAARLPQEDTIISIVGDGRVRPDLEAQARALGLAHRVVWHGLVPAAGRLMAAFDLFVLSSRTEGTPIALFEAMAARVPIVATAVGGVPDVLDEESGRLVAPGSPTLLAEAIDAALTAGPESAIRAARAAERLHRDFDAGPWIDRYLTLARNLLAPEVRHS